ncbi:MAG: hypothetical protein ACREAU_09890 [Nitrosopumilaceae archaeon]
MKRRPFIGLSITVLVLSVIIGIASLPDEVLIDPSSIENTQTIPEDIPLVPTLEEAQDFTNSDAQKKIDDANAELDSLKKEMRELKNELVDLKINSQVPEENLTTTKVEDVTPKVEDVAPEVDSQEESQGKVITINIKDGVGAKQR